MSRVTEKYLHLIYVILKPMRLKAVAVKHFQNACWQRCAFHFIRNLLDSVPRKKRKNIYSDLKTVFLCSSKEEALIRARDLCCKYEKQYHVFATKLDEELEETLAFMGYSIEHWAKIKTTNLIERLNAELKRRIDVIRIFPNKDSALKLIGCLCVEQHEEWISTRKYLEMEPLYNL